MFAVEVNNVVKVFARRSKKRWGVLLGAKLPPMFALNGISLTIETGELIGLLGPNGAGKTTLVKCLATLLIPDSGQARIHGYDVVKESAKVRSLVGLMTGGERSLYWKLSFVDNLNYFAALYGMPKKIAEQRIEELAGIMGLSNRKHERLEKLSSGMRQKSSLARAILHNPPVLFLDEPTLGLDPAFSRFIRGFMKEELNVKQKKTMLLTTHNMEEAETLCHRVILIDKGKIIASGAPSELKKSLKTPNVCRIIFAGEVDEQKFKNAFAGKFLSLQCLDGKNEIKLNSPLTSDLINSISQTLDGPRRIISISEHTPTLEDVFISLTGAKL